MKEYSFTINGNEYKVTVNSVDESGASVCVNGKDYEVAFSGKEHYPQGSMDERNSKTERGVIPGNVATTERGNTVEREKSAERNSGRMVKSPLPGILVDICVSAGQSVKAGQKVAVLEAMKMENDILAESDGTVGKVFASKGDSILEGADIIEII